MFKVAFLYVRCHPSESGATDFASTHAVFKGGFGLMAFLGGAAGASYMDTEAMGKTVLGA